MPPAAPSLRVRVTGVRGRVAQAVHHVRLIMAVKTAAAASGSWLLAQQLPDPAPEYAFYAPLGAVVAMYPTVASSLRQALQAVMAIGLGAVLALSADALAGNGVVVLAVVVGLGVLLGGLPWLGTQRSYVPIAALFVLVIGRGQELRYSASYAGLFLLGALVTVVVNAAYPSFPVRQADHAIRTLRDAVVGHLEHLAGSLRAVDDEPLTDRGPGRPPLTEPTAAARAAVRQTREAARGNLRARRRPDAVSRRYEDFRTLERVVLLVEDLYSLAREQPWGADVVHASSELREPMAGALDALAHLVRLVGEGEADPDQARAVDAAVRDLGRAVRRHEERGGRQAEALVVATVVTTLRRTLSTMAPTDGVDLSPAP